MLYQLSYTHQKRTIYRAGVDGCQAKNAGQGD